MNGLMYSISFENQSITNAGGDNDLFEIGPADDRIVLVHSLYLDQISDVGDAAEEILRYKIIRGHTTGSNGTAVTPRPLIHNGPAAGAACEFVGTTIASSGTGVDLHAGAFNIRAGLQLIFPPDMRPVVTHAQGLLVVRLMAAPADDVTMSGTLYFEEIG
jgi:hypothetical protein